MLLLPPSSGRRWRAAPEVGFALFRLRPTPCPSGIPLLPPSSGRRWRVAPEVGFVLFRLRPTPCPSGVPLPWEGDRWVTHPASPSFLWKEMARSVGSWLRSLFAFGQPPALRASPFHRKGVDRLLTHSSTLHYPFTENGFQILATFIELKMNLKIGQSHYF